MAQRLFARTYVALFLALAVQPAAAQTGALSGRVRDTLTGEIIAGAVACCPDHMASNSVATFAVSAPKQNLPVAIKNIVRGEDILHDDTNGEERGITTDKPSAAISSSPRMRLQECRSRNRSKAEKE